MEFGRVLSDPFASSLHSAEGSLKVAPSSASAVTPRLRCGGTPRPDEGLVVKVSPSRSSPGVHCSKSFRRD